MPHPSTSDELLSLTAARDRGLTSRQWRAPELIRVTRGVKASTEPDGLIDRCRAFSLALPDDVAFSHVTAARLWGLWLPQWAERDQGLHVSRETGRPRIQRTGCVGHRGLERRSVRTRSGLRLTSIVDTWADLGEVTKPESFTTEDLVVVADQVLTHLHEVLEVREGEEHWEAVARHSLDREGGSMLDHHAVLRNCLDGRVRARGAQRLRDALGRARVGVRSPMETRTRLLVVDRGFPEPEVNVAIHGESGWLLEGDLVWRGKKVIGEYQGKHHGGRRQRSYDESRRALAEDEGWSMVQIWAEDVYVPLRRSGMLRRLADKLGLDPGSLDLS